MNPGAYLLLFFSVFLSGASFLVFRKYDPRILRLSLAFTGAFLFAISVLHLIPEVYKGDGRETGMFILAGFFIQVILEFFSEGIEHGHIHVHNTHSRAFPTAIMAGLCLHSFLEGMPLTGKFMDGDSGGASLLAGIILHHLPVAFALMSMLVQSGLGPKSSMLWLILFAGMAPLGAFTSGYVGEGISQINPSFFNHVMAIVIGIFLHISTTILFESGNDHRFNLYKLLTILSGAGVAFVIS